jgi:hypothetical protein
LLPPAFSLPLLSSYGCWPIGRRSAERFRDIRCALPNVGGAPLARFGNYHEQYAGRCEVAEAGNTHPNPIHHRLAPCLLPRWQSIAQGRWGKRGCWRPGYRTGLAVHTGSQANSVKAGLQEPTWRAQGCFCRRDGRTQMAEAQPFLCHPIRRRFRFPPAGGFLR